MGVAEGQMGMTEKERDKVGVAERGGVAHRDAGLVGGDEVA